MNASSQWEMTLQYNFLSHWLGTWTAWSLMIMTYCTWTQGHLCACWSADALAQSGAKPDVGKWPSFHWNNTRLKDIVITKVASPHGQPNSFSIPLTTIPLQQKGPRYTKTKWQSVWLVPRGLVNMFTDAHLHYTAFELLESVDNQATNLQSIFLPCNLFVKRGTSQLTTTFIEQFEGSMPENPKWAPDSTNIEHFYKMPFEIRFSMFRTH